MLRLFLVAAEKTPRQTQAQRQTHIFVHMCAITISADSLFSTPTVHQSVQGEAGYARAQLHDCLTTSRLDIWIFFLLPSMTLTF